ncbi:hypothetical protein BDZ45DRAFT_742549 [Acephala macrosclerotiorum]|nr:hypothetical protein BDZ45DRAFT_742549 [Acephala macrosclerotiorum]
MSGRREFAELDLQFSCLSIIAKRSRFVVKNTISKDPTTTANSLDSGLSSLLRNRGELSLKKFVDQQERKKKKDFGSFTRKYTEAHSRHILRELKKAILPLYKVSSQSSKDGDGNGSAAPPTQRVAVNGTGDANFRSEHKSCQTEDALSLRDRLVQTVAPAFGVNLYDDSPTSEFFTHLIEIITKLEVEQKHDRHMLNWYQSKHGPSRGPFDRRTLIPPPKTLGPDSIYYNDRAADAKDQNSSESGSESGSEDTVLESMGRGKDSITFPSEELKGTQNMESLKSESNDEASVRQSQNSEGKSKPDEAKSSVFSRSILLIHRVNCDQTNSPKHSHQDYLFFDEPRLFAGDPWNGPCRGRVPVVDLAGRLKASPGVLAILYRDYDCEEYAESLRQRLRFGVDTHDKFVLLNPADPSTGFWVGVFTADAAVAAPEAEEISIVSKDLWNTCKNIVDSNSELFPPGAELTEISRPPFLFFYHYTTTLRDCGSKNLQKDQQIQLTIFLDFVEKYTARDFNEARSMIAQGLITRHHVSKLFRPGGVIVSVEDTHPRAYICSGWLTEESGRFTGTSLPCWGWNFDGAFYKDETSLLLPLSPADMPSPIVGLQYYPIEFDQSSMESRLRSRGLKFWSCRRMRFVSYHGLDFYHDSMIETRLMVDFNTYRKMHPAAGSFKNSRDRTKDLLETAMNSDEPPDSDFPLLLPASIYGFNLQAKKWVQVSVELISNVQWNKEAFDRLVMNPRKKELAKALVMIHNTTDQSADIMEGKGNRLIVLLPGGPGTGKTLTAETSVALQITGILETDDKCYRIAEIAEKPLYRVTCGDIGTDAEAVETYLETVLYIGKIWDCVVLLDEADVFLEERTMADMHLFLRVLEYYDGILILTSNRVGTFDESFKSRIQLALHYPCLTEPERRKIWRNFIRMLSKSANSGSEHSLPSTYSANPRPTLTLVVNVEDREDHLEDLAKHSLNGRQIRNAVTTAKKLAMYLKETLDYTHFERVIEVSATFDRYLEQAHGHSDDQWARQEGLR